MNAWVFLFGLCVGGSAIGLGIWLILPAIRQGLVYDRFGDRHLRSDEPIYYWLIVTLLGLMIFAGVALIAFFAFLCTIKFAR